MDIAAIVNLIRFMTFAEAGAAYVNGLIDEDTYDANAYVWAISADRGPAFSHLMELPASERAQEIVKELIKVCPHAYAGAY